jgi:hypothetical protein
MGPLDERARIQIVFVSGVLRVEVQPSRNWWLHRGLQCKLGWRTIEFGDYLSEEQANEVLGALADVLPDLVPTLFPSLDITRHFTKLSLE